MAPPAPPRPPSPTPAPHWRPWLALGCLWACLTVASTDPQRRCTDPLAPSNCGTTLTVFVVVSDPDLLPYPSVEHTPEGALRVVHVTPLMYEPRVADLNLPCVVASANVDGVPYFNAVFQQAQRTCPSSPVVAVLAGDAAVTNATQLFALIDALQAHPWAQHPLQVAGPFAPYAPAPATPADSWVAVSRLPRPRAPLLWMWTPAAPLAPFPVPPFPYGDGAGDAWLVDALLRRGTRHVVDGEGFVKLWMMTEGGQDADRLRLSAYHSERLLFQPQDVGAASIQYSANTGTPHEAPWVAQNCSSPTGVCLERRLIRLPGGSPASGVRTANCSGPADTKGCTEAAAALAAESRQRWAQLADLPPRTPAPPDGSLSGAWLYTMEEQLRRRATPDRRIILTTGNLGYLDFILNFACNMEKLGVTNYAIGAFDNATFTACVARGLPVFRWEVPAEGAARALVYGQEAYRKLTQAKPYVVAEALALHYSVFFVDLDVVLFRDPLSLIPEPRPNVCYAQSDSAFFARQPLSDVTHTLGSKDRSAYLNSGFYFVPASAATIAAFATLSDLLAGEKGQKVEGDQPLFNDLFCRVAPARVVSGSRCVYQEPATQQPLEVRFWPQLLAANGMTGVGRRLLWNFHYRTLAPFVPGQASLHNNYIKGLGPKVRRQRTAGLWWVDEQGICQL